MVSDRDDLWQLLGKCTTLAQFCLTKSPIRLSSCTILELRFSGRKEFMQISLYASVIGLNGEKCHFHSYTGDNGNWVGWMNRARS